MREQTLKSQRLNIRSLTVVLVIASGLALPAAAYDGPVKKEVFTLPAYTTVNDKDPGAALANQYAIEDALSKGGLGRAKNVDANHFLYTVKADQLFSVVPDAKKIKAKFLFVPAKSDLVFPPWMAWSAAGTLRAQGNVAYVFEIDGDGGHLDGLFQISKAAPAIRDFLSR
jgi:homoserine acetyltransferase